jgi:hypothetical protein
MLKWTQAPPHDLTDRRRVPEREVRWALRYAPIWLLIGLARGMVVYWLGGV